MREFPFVFFLWAANEQVIVSHSIQLTKNNAIDSYRNHDMFEFLNGPRNDIKHDWFPRKPYGVLFVSPFLDLLMIFYGDHRLTLTPRCTGERTQSVDFNQRNQKRNFFDSERFCMHLNLSLSLQRPLYSINGFISCSAGSLDHWDKLAFFWSK